jgi:hypothetical protein
MVRNTHLVKLGEKLFLKNNIDIFFEIYSIYPEYGHHAPSGFTQFSISRSGIRANSDRLLLTRTSPSLRA